MPPEIEQFLPENVDTLTEDYFPRGAPLPQPGEKKTFFFLFLMWRTNINMLLILDTQFSKFTGRILNKFRRSGVPIRGSKSKLISKP